jgi:hypothetical protein
MAQYLPWLLQAALATGYPVVELRGWRGHNHGPMADHIYGVMCHHTAGPDPYPGARNDFPSINIVRNGRAGLPGPLAQLGLGWNGTIYLISDGLSYHGGAGSWRGVSGNSRFIGIEAEDAGDGDWAPAQLDAYPRLVASIQDYLNQDAGWVCGHKEYAPRRKIDPAGIHMGEFRGTTLHYLRNPHLLKRGGTPTTPEDELSWDTMLNDPYRNARGEPSSDKKAGMLLGWAATHAAYAKEAAVRNERRLAGLQAAFDKLVDAHANQEGVDAEAIKTAVREAIEESVLDVEITVAGRTEGSDPKA